MVCVNDSRHQWGCCVSLKSHCAVGLGCKTASPSPSLSEVHAQSPPLFRRPSQKSQHYPPFVPGFCQIRTLNLSVPWPWVHQALPFSCVLSLACGRIQKSKSFKGHGKARTHSPPPEESFTGLLPVMFCSRKAVKRLSKCLESMVKYTKKLQLGYLPSACTSVLCC